MPSQPGSDADGVEVREIGNLIDNLDFSEIVVRSEYVDQNGHLGTGYYSVLFGEAAPMCFVPLGMGWARVADLGFTQFTVSTMITYHQELVPGEQIDFSFRVLDVDAKRVHFLLSMIDRRSRALISACETLNICIDLSTRRAAPWPSAVKRKLDLAKRFQAAQPLPPFVGAPVGIRRIQATSN